MPARLHRAFQRKEEVVERITLLLPPGVYGPRNPGTKLPFYDLNGPIGDAIDAVVKAGGEVRGPS